ncbi:PAS domain S-box protein [Cohnella terricola]|nr:PAS domain S-box protein [Cohnella terricola]
MSIKAKLSLLISVIVTIILTLNISIFYFSSKNKLEENLNQEMITIARHIGTSLGTAEKSKAFLENMIGERLRTVAVSALKELDPSIDRVSNEQLVELSRKFGVDHISLWKRTDNDIVVLKSSDPNELNMGSSTMDYWFTAFNQLLNERYVSIPQGQKLPNYWSGPAQYASSDPDHVNKWGYYYDGSTDYIINPYISAEAFLNYESKVGTAALVRSLMKDNSDILGIAGFDPEFFGKPPIIKMKKGKAVYNLDVRGVPFGENTYPDEENDRALVNRANETGQVMTSKARLQGTSIIKSFIPLNDEAPYVVGVVFDYAVVKEALNRQLILHSSISLTLILIAWMASYVIAGVLIRPLRHILDNVNGIAKGRFDSKIVVRSKDELGWLSSRVNAMADNLQNYMSRLRDSAEELRSTKEYLESFVNQTSDAIHVTDLEGTVIQANNAFETMYGWRVEEALNRKLDKIPDHLRSEYEEIRRRIERGESVTDYETVRVRKDGSLIDVSITVSPIRDENEKVMAIAEISRNITARKQAEEAIRRTEKLSVIGQLAAGVAHEIRNPLTTLRGFVQLSQKQGSLSEPFIEIMLSELDRINLIVGEFLVLAKPQAGKPQPTNLDNLLQDMIALLYSQARLLNVSFVTHFDKDLPLLDCDANQMKQVFINIIKNALEAMQDISGTITIELRHDSEASVVVIRVIDQGRGIAADELPRLGEPFFTSKPSGNGLGLMVSQRIIANHKGVMNISSKLGEGTCVEIRLPLR